MMKGHSRSLGCDTASGEGVDEERNEGSNLDPSRRTWLVLILGYIIVSRVILSALLLTQLYSRVHSGHNSHRTPRN